jgi:hypothetical protein
MTRISLSAPANNTQVYSKSWLFSFERQTVKSIFHYWNPIRKIAKIEAKL